MGRRNHFLIFSLLVMLAALIGAILFRGGGAPHVGERPATANAQSADPTASSEATLGVDGVAPAVDPGGARVDASAAADGGTSRTALAAGDARPVSVRVRGRLVDGAGVPVAAQTLRYSRALDLSMVEAEPADLARRLTDWERIPSDRDGRFEFEVPTGVRGALNLAAAANLLFDETGRRELAVRAVNEDTDLGDVPVRTAASIVGRVVDEGDRPIAEARVRAGRAEHGFPGLDFAGPSETTDDEGSFVLRGLPAGEHQLQASAPGFVPLVKTVTTTAGSATTDVVIHMRRGASIAGNIVDDRGRPIAGARVAVFREKTLGEAVSVESLDRREATESDANGWFVLSGLDAATVRLRAWADGHATEHAAQVAIGTSDLVLRLPRLGRVSGVLVDGDGAPIPGSRVTASRGQLPLGVEFEGAGWRGARTDTQGRFSIDEVRPGTATLSARGDGHLPVEGFSVQVQPGETTENVRLVADTGTAVVALVVDSSGAPVAGARVTVHERAEPSFEPGVRRSTTRVRRGGGPDGDVAVRIGDGPERLGAGETGADGRVRVLGLPAGDVVVTGEHAEHAASRPTNLTLPRRGAVETVLTLRAAGFVEVRSVTADGAVAPAARWVVRGPLALGEEPTRQSGETDGGGLVRIGPLAEGSYEIAMQLAPRPVQLSGSMMFTTDEEGRELPTSLQRFSVAAGTTAQVTLVRPVLASLVGTVRDAEGPVTGAELKVVDADAGRDPLGSRGYTTRSSTDGSYSVGDLAPGRYRIEFGRPNQVVPQVEEVDVAAQAEVQRDLMLLGGTVRVLAVDADGAPIDGADVSLERPGESRAPARRGMVMIRMAVEADDSGESSTVSIGDGRRSVRTDDDGVAVLEGVPPGDYTVVVTHRKHVEARLPDVAVVDRTVTEAGTVRMQPAGLLRGRVTGFAADAPQFAMVELQRAGSDDAPRTETAMNGAFQVEGLAPGTWRVRARAIGPDAPDAWGPAVEAIVEAGKGARVDVTLR